MADPISVTCGWCQTFVRADQMGSYRSYRPTDDEDLHLAIDATLVECPSCAEPSLRRRTWTQHEADRFGDQPIDRDVSWYPVGIAIRIRHLPPDVENAWKEASTALACGAPTAAAQMCRKLLSYLAVNVCGSPEGRRFVEYVDDLVTSGEITPSLHPALTHIRKKGNQAAHELDAVASADGKAVVEITGALLRQLYEIPGDVAVGVDGSLDVSGEA